MHCAFTVRKFDIIIPWIFLFNIQPTRPTPALGGPFLAPQKKKKNEIQPAGMWTHYYLNTVRQLLWSLRAKSCCSETVLNLSLCTVQWEGNGAGPASEAKPTYPSAQFRLRTCSAISVHRIALPARLPAAVRFCKGSGMDLKCPPHERLSRTGRTPQCEAYLPWWESMCPLHYKFNILK